MLSACVVFVVSAAAIGVLATDPRCPEQDNPEVPVHLPHPSDCGKFLTCLWGNAIEQSCPAGLHWNDKYQYCDWPENVECGSGQKESDCVSGELMAHVEDCNKFYVCVHGKPWELSCLAGLHFNPSAQVCDYPFSAGCEVSGTTAAATEDAPAESTTVEEQVTESEGTTVEVESSSPSTDGNTDNDQWETDTTAATTENDNVNETSTSSGTSEGPETEPTTETTEPIAETTRDSESEAGQEESSATETTEITTETTTEGTTPAV